MPEPECEFTRICAILWGTVECSFDPKDREVCLNARRESIVRVLNSPQFKKQYAKLSVVKKVLEALPVKNDDFVRDVMDEIEVVGRTE